LLVFWLDIERVFSPDSNIAGCTSFGSRFNTIKLTQETLFRATGAMVALSVGSTVKNPGIDDHKMMFLVQMKNFRFNRDVWIASPQFVEAPARRIVLSFCACLFAPDGDEVVSGVVLFYMLPS